MSKRKGFFIILEGGEFAGKTTQANLLLKYFQRLQISAIKTKEPGGTLLGKKIRRLLLFSREKPDFKAEAFLFSADRSEHYSKVIIPNLQNNKVIVSDRGWPSTIAYQGFGRGISLKFLQYLINEATFKVKPDLVIFLDIAPEVYAKTWRQRQASRNKRLTRFEKEKIDFHRKVREGFLYLAEQDKSHWHIVDAAQSKEKVSSDIISIVNKKLPKYLNYQNGHKR